MQTLIWNGVFIKGQVVPVLKRTAWMCRGRKNERILPASLHTSHKGAGQAQLLILGEHKDRSPDVSFSVQIIPQCEGRRWDHGPSSLRTSSQSCLVHAGRRRLLQPQGCCRVCALPLHTEQFGKVLCPEVGCLPEHSWNHVHLWGKRTTALEILGFSL